MRAREISEPPFPRKNETLVDGEFSLLDNLKPFDVSRIISEVSSYPGLLIAGIRNLALGSRVASNYVTALLRDDLKIQGCDVITARFWDNGRFEVAIHRRRYDELLPGCDYKFSSKAASRRSILMFNYIL